MVDDFEETCTCETKTSPTFPVFPSEHAYAEYSKKVFPALSKVKKPKFSILFAKYLSQSSQFEQQKREIFVKIHLNTMIP